MSLVSVIVPMRNAEPFIEETLRSILQEGFLPMEVVVVDDKSTDGSVARVRAFADARIKIVNGEGRGIAACFNVGLAEAGGDIIMRCDADDLYPVGRIQDQVGWLANHPEFGAVCGAFAAIDGRGKFVSRLADKDEAQEITSELRQGVTRTTFCAFAVRAEVLRSVHGMREYFVTAEDIDLQLRMGERCRVWFEPTVRYFYRLHDSSITHSQAQVERLFYEETARLFQQQRSRQGRDALDSGCPPAPPIGEAGTAKESSSHIQVMLLGRAWQRHAEGEKLKALGIGLRALGYGPSHLSAWRSFAALLLKR